ncbi:uncharacterized protein HKW66_Vig0250500 [Vigna angularis]|uniref:WDR11 second beta-propeller domain-containing protein n=1 Tax=Phaseolus angularis TaxID=3914 RepID=A0A8T0KRI5_PHAAN|nr:uncharacterized protein HKW66_Vig0250500 [Vigna angularis]
MPIFTKLRRHNGGLSTVIAKPNDYCGRGGWRSVLGSEGFALGFEGVEASGSGGLGDGRDGRALAAVAHSRQRSNLVIPLSRDLLSWWRLCRSDCPVMLQGESYGAGCICRGHGSGFTLQNRSFNKANEKSGGYINKVVVTCLRSGLNRMVRVMQKPERTPIRALRTSSSGR